ncbi:MAG: 5'-methylthioadenosine/adenosylhomocysteine nucleosidase [Cyanobacteriota bacterium]|nr:5'-methylthioadenosine/adenosylhomocysteine nucleosidase [Cyanobacteriota bacterium]|tara:strand:- start:1226 stop:1981 length:756 start_codon:yes stop_codon:yes gene_type:complete
MTRPLHFGLLGAMPEEIGSDLSHLKDLSCSNHGDLTIHKGSLGDTVQLSLAWSGWGKVSAARAATRLLASDPNIDLLVFTGVAGAADPTLRQWDVVLADAVVQHDMDARPLFPRFTLPALNQDRLQPQQDWFNWAKTALLEAYDAGGLEGFARPSSGLIATGDRFIGDAAVLQTLRDDLPGLRAVEMEGAAVAQVAEQEGIPWLVLRVISDGADEAAAQSFEDFLQRYEQQAWRLIEALVQRCNVAPRRCA